MKKQNLKQDQISTISDPKKEIVYRTTSVLIPYVGNSRTHSTQQTQQIASSIKEFGFTNPVLIDEDNGIIAGHGRVLAAQLLGMDEVPCIVLSGMTEAKKRAYVIADNKLALNAGWDDEMLRLEFEDLKAMDFDLDLTGFSQEEIDKLMPKQVEGLTDEDAAPDAPVDPVTVPGDVWILGDHRLMCGDSTNIDAVEKLMDGQKIDLCFSDPPYGIDIVQGKSSTVGGAAPTKFSGTVGAGPIVPAKTYLKIKGDETTDVAESFYNNCVALDIKNIVLWGGNYFTNFLPPSRCWVVWDKEMTGNFSEAEMAWSSFSKGGIKVFKFLWNGLSREGNRKDELKARVHPTQKPVGLFQMIFERFDGFKTIFDGFGGSGSTLIACEKTGRHAFLMELEPHYCDVIIKRWQEFTGKQAVHAETGEVFNGNGPTA